MKKPLTVSVTGAAGQISYAFLPRLLAGDVFGVDQPIHLKLIDIESSLKGLEGVVLELEDLASPLLASLNITASAIEGFERADWAVLLGGMPRKQGMERKDLLAQNAAIFKQQGLALDASASFDVRVLVVANPCNTNCLVAQRNAQNVPSEHFFAMTRLDENRAKSLLARRAHAPASAITRLSIWGNHSTTQYPDAMHAYIADEPASDVFSPEWLQGEFVSMVQNRGAEVIKARGSSSAASAANAVVDSLRGIVTPTPHPDWTSLAVVSEGEYGVPKGLVFGYPIISDGERWKIVQGIEHNPLARRLIKASIAELEEERAAVKDLIS